MLTVLTTQLGWATSDCRYLAQDGCGIGDDEHSFSFDGCRRLLWYRQQHLPHRLPQWRPGERVVFAYINIISGCLIAMDSIVVLAFFFRD
jgi:hypothetical protein